MGRRRIGALVFAAFLVLAVGVGIAAGAPLADLAPQADSGGDLRVTAGDEYGTSVPGAEIKRYDEDWNHIDTRTTDGDGEVVWYDVEAGEYNLELYSDGEFWGGTSATVLAGETADVAIDRTTPYRTELTLTVDDDPIDDPIEPGKTVTISPGVEHGEGYGVDTRVTIEVPSGDFEADRGPIRIEPGETGWFGAEFTPSEGGTYCVDLEVEADYGPSWALTDEESAIDCFTVEEEYELEIETDGEGVVSVAPPWMSTRGTTQTYEEGTEVELTADPDPGYTFDGWEGDVSSLDAADESITVVMDEDKEITATFVDETTEYTLSVDAESGGSLGVDPPGVSTDSWTDAYEEGTEVELTANPGSDHYFDGWEGDVSSWNADDESITVVMDEDKEITATFVEETTEYTLSVDAETGGSLGVDPPGVSTDGWTDTYEEGTEVELTANSWTDHAFDGWEGDLSSLDAADESITVVMDEDREITATFVEEEEIDGDVEWISPDAGTYGAGETVETTASVENTGNVAHTFFVGYSAIGPDGEYYDNDGETGTTVTLDPDESTTVDLSWEVEPDAPAGEYDVVVVMWEESDHDDLHTQLDDEWEYGAFEIEEETTEYELEIETEGEGVVSVAPPWMSTHGTTQTYEEGTEVELTANPDSGYTFDSWEGDVSSLDADDESITVVMDEDKEITATFTEETAEYSLSVEAESGGDLGIDPPGVNSEEWTETYEEGTEIELTANPWGDHEFDGWEGDVSSWDADDESITVVMDEDKEITATFTEETAEYSLSVEAESGGDLGIDPPGVSTDGWTETYEEGTEVELTANPWSDHEFDGWEGDVSTLDADDETITVVMDEARELTATFEQKEEIDGDVEWISPDAGTYGVGETVETTASVENTGNVAHTFFVGYSAIGPDGEYYDNDGETGTTVTLDPDESTTIDLSWEVGEDAPEGEYDVEVVLWEESDRDDLHTDLDRTTEHDAFDVERDFPPPESWREDPDQMVTIEEGESLSFVVEAEDHDQELEGVEWYVNHSQEDVTDGLSGTRDTDEWSYTFEAPGSYTVEANVFNEDDGYNEEPVSWTVIVEEPVPEPPESWGVSPDEEVTIEAGESRLMQFVAEAEDPDGELHGVEWYVDGDHEETTYELGGSADTGEWAYTFDEPGTYTVVADVFDENDEFNENPVVWTVTVEEPDPEDELTVEVVETDGEPIPDAEVTLYGVGEKTTGSDGRATFSWELDSGTRLVVDDGSGYSPEIRNVEPEQETVVVEFSRKEQVVGQIYDTDGDPVENAAISIEGTPLETTTGGSGAFVFDEPIPTGVYDLSVEGYETTEIVVEPGRDTHTIQVRPEDGSGLIDARKTAFTKGVVCGDPCWNAGLYDEEHSMQFFAGWIGASVATPLADARDLGSALARGDGTDAALAGLGVASTATLGSSAVPKAVSKVKKYLSRYPHQSDRVARFLFESRVVPDEVFYRTIPGGESLRAVEEDVLVRHLEEGASIRQTGEFASRNPEAGTRFLNEIDPERSADLMQLLGSHSGDTARQLEESADNIVHFYDEGRLGKQRAEEIISSVRKLDREGVEGLHRSRAGVDGITEAMASRNWNQFKGAAWEAQAASRMMSQGNQVEELRVPVDDFASGSSGEIDMVARVDGERTFVEAKDVRWNDYSRSEFDSDLGTIYRAKQGSNVEEGMVVSRHEPPDWVFGDAQGYGVRVTGPWDPNL